MMHQPNILISTCGTSLLTNDSSDEMRKLLNSSANFQEKDFEENDKSMILQLCEEKRIILQESKYQEIRKLSAELNGLIGFYDGDLQSGKKDMHYLLHTDTWLGKIVADLIKEWLESQCLKVQICTFNELNTKHIESFHHGIIELIQWCGETLPGYQQKNYKIIFNLVGGFKSIQGFMQTIGMIYADEIVYIFETANELLRIPRLPIDIEKSAKDHLENNVNTFRLLDRKGAALPFHKCDDLMDTFLYKLENEAELSGWGRLIWDKCKKEIYSKRLFDAPSDNIQYSKKFEENARKLSPENIFHLNQRIDDFYYFLTANKKENKNLNRLDFKKLQGTPKPLSTHEFDAWSDQSAWRVFLHEEDKIWVLDDIGHGLH